MPCVRAGYGTEAISYIAGMLQHGLVAPEDLWITQVRLAVVTQADLASGRIGALSARGRERNGLAQGMIERCGAAAVGVERRGAPP